MSLRINILRRWLNESNMEIIVFDIAALALAETLKYAVAAISMRLMRSKGLQLDARGQVTQAGLSQR